MVDSHCHIAGPEFQADLPDVVQRARAAGVDRAFVILAADDADEVARAGAVTDAWPEVRYAVGVHPHAAGKFADDASAAAALVAGIVAQQPLARAVGEIGLDYHYDFSPRAAQCDVFRSQIALARQLRLPLVLHTREADEDTFAILREQEATEVGGVFHCFTGDRATAARALDLGFHISLSGIVTFPKAHELKEVARMIPLDRLLVETDSPFLAPVPFRGGRNEPARVAAVVEAIAALRGVPAGGLREATHRNFERLFAP